MSQILKRMKENMIFDMASVIPLYRILKKRYYVKIKKSDGRAQYYSKEVKR